MRWQPVCVLLLALWGGVLVTLDCITVAAPRCLPPPQDRSSGKRVKGLPFGKQCVTEHDIFEVLGLDYVDPRMRCV